MKNYIRLFRKLAYHKYCVFRAGLLTRAPLWRLIVHDLSKFYPSEFPHYAGQYISDEDYPRDLYLTCWIKHQNRNKHHWEFWVATPKITMNDFNCFDAAPMPMSYVREMIADWMGASKTYEGYWPDFNNYTWFDEHYPKMILHDDTKERILTVIEELKDAEKKST